MRDVCKRLHVDRRCGSTVTDRDQDVGWIANGDWLRYDNVNFGSTGLRELAEGRIRGPRF
jgi:hypothetical protein